MYQEFPLKHLLRHLASQDYYKLWSNMNLITFGKNQTLDYRQARIIPQRLQGVADKAMKKLQMLLLPKLTTEELS
ncbi:hypothetical protein HPULCUR_009433 [Helicostylum pulchrum]|uniref:Uncharacterized protein n=1 Tax=Helicostylum pulchrum TaxID=562976 RepID=A0ABP9YBH3_9FUNG